MRFTLFIFLFPRSSRALINYSFYTYVVRATNLEDQPEPGRRKRGHGTVVMLRGPGEDLVRRGGAQVPHPPDELLALVIVVVVAYLHPGLLSLVRVVICTADKRSERAEAAR